MPRVDAWTHEEMILVLNLYLKLPFECTPEPTPLCYKSRAGKSLEHHLADIFTHNNLILQQGISSNQLKEMQDYLITQRIAKPQT